MTNNLYNVTFQRRHFWMETEAERGEKLWRDCSGGCPLASQRETISSYPTDGGDPAGVSD